MEEISELNSEKVEIADKLQETAKIIGKPFQKGFDERRNLDGRPTQTLKEFQAKEFQNMTDEEKRAYLNDIDKKTKWEMAEGRPQTNTDLTTKGESLNDTVTDEKVKKLIGEYLNEQNSGTN